MSRALALPLSAKINGVEWKLFCITYKTVEDQTLSAYFYATSFEHASVLLGDLKDTGKIEDCILGVTK